MVQWSPTSKRTAVHFYLYSSIMTGNILNYIYTSVTIASIGVTVLAGWRQYTIYPDWSANDYFQQRESINIKDPIYKVTYTHQTCIGPHKGVNVLPFKDGMLSKSNIWIKAVFVGMWCTNAVSFDRYLIDRCIIQADPLWVYILTPYRVSMIHV